MKYTVNFLLAFLAMVLVQRTPVQAQHTTTVELNNGSRITGLVTVQRPGTDIMIKVERAELVVEQPAQAALEHKNVKYESLPREWKRWSLMHNALQGNADGRYLAMYDIKTRDYTYNGVVRVERNSTPKVVYVQVMPETYRVKWGDIKSVSYSKPSANAKGGTDDELTTFGGKTYRGTIVRLLAGKTFSMATADATVDIPVADVYERRKVVRVSGAKLYDQAGCTNSLLMKDGTVKEGVIELYRYGKKPKDQYVQLVAADGKTEKLKPADIVEYRTAYAADSSMPYRKGGVYANEFRMRKAAVRTEDGQTAYVDRKVFTFPEGIAVTFKAVGTRLADGWYLVALDNMTLADGTQTQGYTAATRTANAIQPSSTDLVGEVGSISFGYLSPGYYALVNDSSSDTYIIKIKK